MNSDLLPLLRELGDLKRVRSADAPGSAAERLFRRGWAALARGDDPAEVARRTAAAAVAAARLGDLDRDKLIALGVEDAEAVLERGFDAVADVLDPAVVALLRPALGEGAPADGPTPAFVDQLAQQPRAGVTCPGKPRLMLQPAENHAEHCLMVAVYGVLLSQAFGADPTAAFVAGMAHHLHNALMPDAGFTGEVLLGDALDGVIARARDAGLAQLDAPVRATVAAALAPIGGDATPEARAFHAADVIDRVLEIEQHARANVRMDVVLDDYELVHAGPVKTFHDRVLAEVGLL
jgi:5'-deoxynucleotidase YfbR-like HD superfamily hydrolase